MKKTFKSYYLFYILVACINLSLHAVTLSAETKAVLKTALETGDITTIDALYTSIMTGDTSTFSSITTNTPQYLEQLAANYVHPTTIVTLIDNNATLRDLAMFDYFTDDMAITTVQQYFETHNTKPFMPSFRLLECYKALLSLQLYADSITTDNNENQLSKDEISKAILAIIFYSNTYGFNELLKTLTTEEESIKNLFHTPLLRLSVALKKPEIVTISQTHIPTNTIIKPTLKDILTTAHHYFQALYCKE
jgi:hypothetical protein